MTRSAVALATACFAGGMACAAPAEATTASYSVFAYEGSIGKAFSATNDSIAAIQATSDYSSAQFIYTGAINWGTSALNDPTSSFFGSSSASILAYSGSGPATVSYGPNGANFLTKDGFLATNGSVGRYGYGSLYTIYSDRSGYGGQALTITHNAGVSVTYETYDSATNTYPRLTLPGFTADTLTTLTETVVLPTDAVSFEIIYARENGGPSYLDVQVPEPVSLALMGTGLAGLGIVLRRRRRAHTA